MNSLLNMLLSLAAAQATPTPPLPVIDVHMHTPPQQQLAAWTAAMDGLNVRGAVLVGGHSIIDEELLVQQAQRDTSIQVTDEEIASGVEEQVRKV